MIQTTTNRSIFPESAKAQSYSSEYEPYGGSSASFGFGDETFCPFCNQPFGSCTCGAVNANGYLYDYNYYDYYFPPFDYGWYFDYGSSDDYYDPYPYGGGGDVGGGDVGGGSTLTPTPTPPSIPTYSPMGDPIDLATGLPNVTARFNEDIRLAFEQFCGSAYPFNAQVNSYGNLMEGIFSYPQDYINYMMNFINQVKGGAPWDLKAEGNGYSYAELGNNYKAIYNGKEYNFDDFGNITFGVAAVAYGFPIDFSKAGAGFYQILSGTSEWSYISSYFDAPRDQEMIERGIQYFLQQWRMHRKFILNNINMKNSLLLITAIVFFIGCTQSKNDKNELNYIDFKVSKDTMIDSL
ncbi:MAG: polymorphic toxin type 44 domain-containing protein, partial [Ignavibacteria bacterium]|nr:polymorphic toxin type 44 domain-containing protein [Ignavibacteria bacterium]